MLQLIVKLNNIAMTPTTHTIKDYVQEAPWQNYVATNTSSKCSILIRLQKIIQRICKCILKRIQSFPLTSKHDVQIRHYTSFPPLQKEQRSCYKAKANDLREKKENTKYVMDFHQGKIARSIGEEMHTIHDLRTATDDQLEKWHDYIQWFYILDKQSGANNDAPILGVNIEDSEELRQVLCSSTIPFHRERMVRFFGYHYDEHNQLIQSGNYQERRSTLLGIGARLHNLLRLTRILDALILIKAWGEAWDFINMLLCEYNQVVVQNLDQYHDFKYSWHHFYQPLYTKIHAHYYPN